MARCCGEWNRYSICDGNVEHQQNLSTVKMAFIVLAAVDNKIETLLPLMLDVNEALRAIENGDVVRVSAE